MSVLPGRLYGVGVGPGDPELVTVKAARLIGTADVIAFHCARHGRSMARRAAEPYIRASVIEERLMYPVTVETTDHPGGYAGALEDFYAAAADRLGAHLDVGRTVVVLCEGDPAFYGSYQHLHARLASRYDAQVVPGVSSVSAAAAAVGRPLVQHEEALVVLPGTVPEPELAAHLGSGRAAVVMKLGRSFEKVRGALERSGRLRDSWYVERASHADERVAKLADIDAASVPYMAVAVVPGEGVRSATPAGVTVVGLGPGDDGWTTPEVSAALAAASDLIGYEPYVARVPVRAWQRRHVSGNQVESDRARQALALAAAGANVVVVSSGDPGVFAMAAAVLEEAERAAERFAEVEITVLPGVSAAQAVAARVGAPLGHDFAVLSLSDRLKPWSVVEHRLALAAQADLVLALYNPRSKARPDQLERAKAVLLAHRAAVTPVVVGRAVGRADESVSVTTLGGLDVAAVDMATLLIVGSSRTRRHGSRVYTPRHVEH